MYIVGVPQDVALEGGQTTRQCEEYKCLEMKGGNLDVKIKNRNIPCRKVMAAMNGLLWHESIPRANNQTIYNALLKYHNLRE